MEPKHSITQFYLNIYSQTNTSQQLTSPWMQFPVTTQNPRFRTSKKFQLFTRISLAHYRGQLWWRGRVERRIRWRILIKNLRHVLDFGIVEPFVSIYGSDLWSDPTHHEVLEDSWRRRHPHSTTANLSDLQIPTSKF